MANIVSRKIVLPEAQDLLDAYGMQQDIQYAIESAQLIKQAQEDNLGRSYTYAFTVAAVATYGRVFNSGVRSSKVRLLLQNDLDDDYTVLHQKFMSWRTMHIVHSINGFEVNYLTAGFTEKPESNENLEYVKPTSTRIIGFSTEDADEFIDICEVHRVALTAYIETERRRIENLVRELDVVSLLAPGDWEDVFPLESKVAQARKNSKKRRES